MAIIAASTIGFVIHTKRNNYLPVVAKPSVAEQKSLLESNNNDKVDAAINKAISKQDDKKLQKAEEQSDDEVYDAAKEFLQIRAMGPMVVFSKLYCPFSKNLKQLLRDHYSITPEPIIVELDKHKHGAELQEYLKAVTERATVPNVLVGSKSHVSRGGSDTFNELHREDALAEQLTVWGNKELSVKRIEVPSNL